MKSKHQLVFFITSLLTIVLIPLQIIAATVEKGCFGTITLYVDEEKTVSSAFDSFAESVADNVRWSCTEEFFISDTHYRNDNLYFTIKSEDIYAHKCVLVGRRPTDSQQKVYCHLNYKGTRYIGYYNVEVKSLGKLTVNQSREGDVVYLSCPEVPNANLFYFIGEYDFTTEVFRTEEGQWWGSDSFYDYKTHTFKDVISYTSAGITLPNGSGRIVVYGFASYPKYEVGYINGVYSTRTSVSSITLDRETLFLEVGSSQTLQATVLPSNATDKTVTWKSNDTSVVTVSSNGTVTAVSVGTATITCKANDGSGIQAACIVTVTPSDVKVTSISLNKTSLSLETGQSETLSAAVYPNNATNKTVAWKSSNTSVATVSSNGTVTAVSKGTSTITCTASDGSGVSASCVVTVTEPAQTAEVYFVSVTCDNPDRANLTQNDELLFHATFENKGATDDVYSMIALIDTKVGKIIAHGDYDIRSFKGGEQTTVEYAYPLDTIAPGKYEATVLFFDFNYNGGGSWIYGGDSYLWEITVKESSGRKGDVNDDNDVNGTDLVALTNMILGRSAKTPNGDVNGDGEVNGTDYVVLTNIILNRSNARRKAAIQIPKELQETLDKKFLTKEQ